MRVIARLCAATGTVAMVLVLASCSDDSGSSSTHPITMEVEEGGSTARTLKGPMEPSPGPNFLNLRTVEDDVRSQAERDLYPDMPKDVRCLTASPRAVENLRFQCLVNTNATATVAYTITVTDELGNISIGRD